MSEIRYESFRYIHSPPYEHRDEDVLERKYKTVESLSSKFIVFAHGAGYRVYKSVDEYLKHTESLPASEKVFHEVIMNKPQKLKFDIDASLSAIEELINKCDVTSKISKVDAIYEDMPDNIWNNVDFPVIVKEDPVISEWDAFMNDLCVVAEEPLTELSQIQINPRDLAYEKMLTCVIDAIKTAFFVSYQMEIDDENLVVCESKSQTAARTKYSNHIIIDKYCVSSCDQSKEFTRRVRSFIPAAYHKFLDMSVNKSLQNFRLIGCHKTDDDRVKSVGAGITPHQTIITHVADCKALPDIYTDVTTETFEEIHADDARSVLRVCAENNILKHNTFTQCRGNMFLFSRKSAEFCEICNREHVSDHSVFVTAVNNNGLVSVYKHCRRYLYDVGKDGKHFMIIGEFMSDVVTPVKTATLTLVSNRMSPIDTRIKNDIESMATKPLFPTTNLFDQLPIASRHVYEAPVLSPFENAKTLFVRAAMKMGKTKALSEYVDRCHADGIRNQRIIVLSFRQTFSSNLKEKFPNYTVYSEVTGPLRQEKLIVQVESLYRLEILDGCEPPDLLILDECESIFEQFDSGLLRGNFNACFAKFQWIMRYARSVICMDAGLSDRTYRIVEQMRGLEGAMFHHNTYRNATNDQYWLTGDKLKWLGLLYSCVDADERIAIPISSLAEAKVLANNLTKKYPAKTIRLYSSETSNSEKRKHFADVNAYWLQSDILIYTPTVSAGVSFEQKHFSKVFGYFTDQSCPVETCIQMIGRIRDVGDHSLFICLAARGNNLPTTVENIRKHVMDTRTNLMRGFDATGLRVEYGPNGDIIYHHGDYFHLWLENQRVCNLSKNYFIKLFIHTVAITGANVRLFDDDEYASMTGSPLHVDGVLCDEISALKDEHASIRSEIREAEVKRLVVAPDITQDEAEVIKADMMAQHDVTDESRAAYFRFRLRVAYGYHGNIDEKFITKYNDMKTRYVFKNLCRLATHDTVEAAIANIQAEEYAVHKYLMEEDNQTADLNRRYVFDRHRYAIGLLKLCGWKHIDDPVCIHTIEIAENLRKSEKIYWDNIRGACSEFCVRPPLMKDIAVNRAPERAESMIGHMMTPISKILNIMYGITIGKTKENPNIHYLVTNTLFTTDPVISERKCKPLVGRAIGNDNG